MQNKILIIDDDKELCEEITEILKSEGYFVDSEYDGVKGEKNIRENNYDLLILDLKLPGLSGFDILKSIRKKKNKTRIIVISGRPKNSNLLGEKTTRKNKDEDEENTLKLADAVISKPFDVIIMLDKIRELLEKEKKEWAKLK